VPSSTGPLRVLVVEDDPAVRDATSVVLRSLGHTVIQAPDVAAGLTTVRAGAERIDVVLTDAVMPGQSGLDLARILLAERPDLPVILMSGYAEETINYDAAKTAGMVFIEKPFTSAVIARALAEVRSSAQIGGSVA
jgi:CheY-like chemotaxis protein